MFWEAITIPITLSNIASMEVYSIPTMVEEKLITNLELDSLLLQSFYELPVKIDWGYAAIERIQKFNILEDSWDGAGAVAPDRRTIGNAIRFIENLSEFLISELNPENIICTPYGTIVLDWYNNEDLLSVEIGEKEMGFFSEINGESITPASDKFIINENNLLFELDIAFKNLYKRPIL
jgi:hypothetical protein